MDIWVVLENVDHGADKYMSSHLTRKGAYIEAANFGDLAIDSNDPTEITLTLRYDYAILQF